MATYGYSTPYMGQRQPTLPPGYMEAATAPGRNIAAGIQQFAAGLGQTIQRYQANKAETEAATQTFETLSGMAQQALATDPQYQALQQYYETGQLPAGVTENDLKRFENKVQADRSMLNKMAGIGEKFGDMSLAKKKAAIGDMAMVLGQYQNRATEDLKRRQLELSVSEAERALKAEQDISDLTRYAAGLPSTRNVEVQTTKEIQVPFLSAQAAQPTVQSDGQPSATETVLARQFLNRAGIAARDLQRYAESIPQQVTPPQITTQEMQDRAAASKDISTAFGLEIAKALFPQQRTPTQMESALAQENYRRQLAAAEAQAAPLKQQAEILSQAAGRTLQAPTQAQVEPNQPPAFEMRGVSVPSTETRVEPIPYAETRRNLAQYAASRNMSPKVFQALDKVMEVAGMQKPLQVEQMTTPEGISVIRADGKIDIIPPVRQPNQQPSEADKAFVMNINGYLSAAEDLKSTIDKYGTFEAISPTGAANLNSIPYQLAIMYAKIMDPGSVAREGEVEAAKKYLIPLGMGVRKSVALASINRQIEEMKKKGALYQQMTGRPAILSQDQVEKVNAASGQFRLIRGQGIKPVQ